MDDIEAFPDGLDDFYEEQMERVSPNGLAWKIVCLLTAAKDLMHAADTVGDFLQSNLKEHRKAIAALSRFFPVRGHCFHVYHKSVWDWLTNEKREDDLTYLVNVKEVNKEMAENCLRF